MINNKREEFRNKVFERDSYKCIIPNCNQSAKDAHHLMERRMWIDESELEGYFLDNGVSLCENHHKLAERNILCPQVLRTYANITAHVLPKQFAIGKEYDKWGKDLKMPNRLWIKYPSTPYLPFSETATAPIANIDDFIGYPIVITMKMDGSNIVLTDHHIAARNGRSAEHRSFDELKSIHASIKHLIPSYLQIFGEWLYAKHSIHYTGNNALNSYLQIFGAYNNQKRIFLGWDEVEKWSSIIGYPTAPVIGKMTFDNKYRFINDITEIAKRRIQIGNEGIVIRSIYPFHYGQFGTYTAKYVRPNHVQTDIHWKNQKITKNELEE